MPENCKKLYNSLDRASEFEVVLEKLDRIEKLIKDLNINSKEVLNFQEACQFLGFSSSYLYKCTAAGIISHFKPSKKIYFNRQELVEWLQQNRVCSNKELITMAESKIEKFSK